jgi:hypothetical protein
MNVMTNNIQINQIRKWKNGMYYMVVNIKYENRVVLRELGREKYISWFPTVVEEFSELVETLENSTPETS